MNNEIRWELNLGMGMISSYPRTFLMASHSFAQAPRYPTSITFFLGASLTTVKLIFSKNKKLGAI